MACILEKLDPFGHLSARTLLQSWLGSLVGIHCLWILIPLFMGQWLDLAYVAALFQIPEEGPDCSRPGCGSATLRPHER
jgi:hypothetical protein